jgi:hypothetical protein
MTLTRITSTLAAVALGGVVVATTYGAQAAGSSGAPERSGSHHHSRVAVVDHFQPPVLHKYGPNGMRLGLHCETKDMS